MIELSPNQARKIVIAQQGLHKSNAFGSSESGVLNCISQLSYIQIDTISVINRAHHHTLWSRVSNYRADHLDTLQREKQVFEYWSHAAAYLPIEDYRFCLPYMNAIAAGQKHWRAPDKKAMKEVLARITKNGPMKARDFENHTKNKPVKRLIAKHPASDKSLPPNKKSNAVWSGAKPSKKALEQLFIEGKLMISHRDGFQKVFDLAERVLPDDLDTSNPSTEEFCRYLIDRTIDSQGLASELEMRYLRKGVKSDLARVLQEMLENGEIVKIQVSGNQTSYYTKSSIVDKATAIRVTKKVQLLSPFDNLVIQRKRVSQLFDFNFQIECYLPEAKRKYGYFCLPILYGADFVGRLDPKTDRKNRVLCIRNLVVEKELDNLDQFLKSLADSMKKFAKFNNCDLTTIERCSPKKILKPLKQLLTQ